MMSDSRYQKIVVPLDGSGWSQRALPHALDIARSTHAEIILLHVFVPPLRQFTDQLALRDGDDQMQGLREQAKKYLIGVRSELRNESVQVRTHYMEGADVSHLICNFVNSEDADLVVMSTRGRSGLGRLLYGSVAKSVVECIDVPVLLIKPDRD